MTRVDLSPGKIAQMYRSGMSVGKIAKHFGCGNHAIEQRLKEAGVPLRMTSSRLALFRDAKAKAERRRLP